jgi:hypothetical protein
MDNMIDFGTLFRAAFAERDPERKQVLLSQVQRAIASCEPGENAPMIKLGLQSVSQSKIVAAA